MDTETGGGPAIGRSVWVIDDSAPERKVPGRIVSDATEGLFGEADSIVVEVGRGHVRTLLFAKRGIEWDYACS
jgi:hypothetical protein